MTRVYVVVEGQTEESFVQDVLAEVLWPYQVYLTPIILGVPGHQGGRTNYARVKKDVLVQLKQDHAAYCSTMLDFYGLGRGFPGTPPPAHLSSLEKVKHVEQAVRIDIYQQIPDLRPDVRFLPYLQLHEFEGLLFSDPTAFAASLKQPQLAQGFQTVRDLFETPEDINNDPETCPSQRVIDAWPSYRKVLEGTLAARAIGIETMRRECPHFRDWLGQLQALGEQRISTRVCYTGRMPHRLALHEMAARIRSRSLSPVELVDAHLKQIERCNPKLNAFVRVLADEARAQAKLAEERQMRGDFAGALHGVPVTIKDCYDMTGLPTTCGSRFFADRIAASDATAVVRLRGAGAIPLGKTNTPEFLSNYESDNFITGRSNNPWDLARTPGGSSGGESAAISSFCSAGGIGSDGGGSIRVPAHFCGIAGLKPTPGRVSAAGHVPEINHPGGLLGVGGPMARSARDVRMLFEVLAGYDSQDPFSAPAPLRQPDLAGLRIGVMEQFYQVPVEPGVREAVRKAAQVLAQLGFAVEPWQPQGLERAPNLWWFFFGILPARFTQKLIEGREDQAHWTGTEFLHQALAEPDPSGMKVVENLAVRDKMRGSMLGQMEQHPVILLPACGVAAFEHRQRRYVTGVKDITQFEAMMPVHPGNLLGLPGVVIPFHVDERGLPVGIQLMGRPYDEELLLELAVRMEEARGPFPSPPGYSEG